MDARLAPEINTGKNLKTSLTGESYVVMDTKWIAKLNIEFY